MSSQKYNLLSMYKKNFMQFKTKALSFMFFLAGRLQVFNMVAANFFSRPRIDVIHCLFSVR